MSKPTYAMPLETLKQLRESGQFHHATYRNRGIKASDGFRGYSPAGFFPVGDPELDAAHELVRGTGISVGSYEKG